MKNLVTALVLATSFVAFAQDAKPPAPAADSSKAAAPAKKSSKKSSKKAAPAKPAADKPADAPATK